MTSVIAVPADGDDSGLHLFVTPGWDLEILFTEALGTVDTPASDMLKRALEEALLTDNAYTELNMHVLAQIMADDMLNRELHLIVDANVTIAEVVHFLAGKYIIDSVPMSDNTYLIFTRAFEDAFGATDLLKKELTRSVVDQFSIEELLLNAHAYMRESINIEDDIVVEAVKLLTESAVVTDGVMLESVKLLSNSMVFNEALEIVLLTLLDSVDAGEGQESELVDRLHQLFDYLLLGSELTMHFSTVLNDESTLADTLLAEAFKLFANNFTLTDNVTEEIFQFAYDALLTVSFELTDRLVMRMSLHSLGRSSTSSWAERDGDNKNDTAANSVGEDSSATETEASGSAVQQRQLQTTTVRF